MSNMIEQSNINIVIQSLQELSCWLECSKPNQDEIKKIVIELESSDIDDLKVKQLRMKLSKKILFHPKYLGDVYVPDFVGDGTPCAWVNYLNNVAEICQKNLFGNIIEE